MSADSAAWTGRNLPRGDGATRKRFTAIWRHRPTKVGAVLTALVIAFGMLGPYFAPHPGGAFIAPPFTGPGGGAALGTDYLGQDVLSALLRGGRSIIWMAFAATSIGGAAGIAIGLVAAYANRTVEELIMRSLDVAYAFPYIVLILLFLSMLGRHLWLIVLLTGVSFIPGIARQVRGITKEVLTREYVEAAEIIGVPRWKIMIGDILPNLMTPLLVEYSQRLTWAVGVMASISFLGFGPQPPNTDWGLMINQNRAGLVIQPWGVVMPILCIGVFAIGTNLFAEGVSRTIAGVDRPVDAT